MSRTVHEAFTELLKKEGTSFNRDPFELFKKGWDARQRALDEIEIVELRKMFQDLEDKVSDSLDDVNNAGDDLANLVKNSANYITNEYRKMLIQED